MSGGAWRRRLISALRDPARDAGAAAGAEPGPARSDLGLQAARGSIVAIGGQATRAVLGGLNILVLMWILEPGDFGLFAIASIATALMGVIANLGLSEFTVQSRRIDADTVSALFLLNAGLGLAAACALVALAPTIAWVYGDAPLAPLLVALAPTVVLAAAAHQHIALLQRAMQWAALERVAILAQLAATVAAIGLALGAGAGVWALVAQVWVASGATLVLVWTASAWRPTRRPDWREARAAVAFGLPLMGFGLVNFLHRQGDDALIGWRWGASELGLYNRAYAILMLPMQTINAPVASALIPVLSRLAAEPERWRRTYLDALAVIVLISSGMAAGMSAVAQPAVVVLFGPEWAEAGAILAVLALALFGSPLNTAGWIYISLGRSRHMMAWSLVATPILLICFFVGVGYGAFGVAVAYALALNLLLVPGLWFAIRGTALSGRDLLGAIAPGHACGLVACAAGHAALWRAGALDPLEQLALAGAAAGASFVLAALLAVVSVPALRLLARRMANAWRDAAGDARGD